MSDEPSRSCYDCAHSSVCRHVHPIIHAHGLPPWGRDSEIAPMMKAVTTAFATACVHYDDGARIKAIEHERDQALAKLEQVEHQRDRALEQLRLQRGSE